MSGPWPLRVAIALLVGLLLPAASRADEAANQYAAAAGYYAHGEWKLAAEAFEVFLKANPNHAKAVPSVFFLGESLVQLGQYEAARTRFAEYLRREPQGRYARSAQFRSAEAAYLDRRFDEAKTALEEFRKAHPDDPLEAHILPYLGEIALAKKDMPAAETLFREALRRFPDGALQEDCRMGLARALIGRGQIEEAQGLLGALASKPGCLLAAEARFRLGLVEMDQKRWDEAAKVLLTLAAENPKHELTSAIRVHAGEALLRAGRIDEARAQFDAVLADARPDDPWRASAARGKIQIAQTRDAPTVLDSEAAQFAERYAKSPLLPEVRRLHGRSLLERKQYAKAVDQLEPLVRDAKPEEVSPQDRYLLALAYQGCGQSEKALAEIEPVAASADEPLRTDALLVRGALLVSLGQHAKAVDPLEQFLAARPEGDGAVRAKAQLAVCLARSWKLDQAKRLHLELLAQHATHEAFTPAVEQLAEAAYAAGDYAYSRELFQWLVDQSHEPDSVIRGLSGLGWSQLKQNEPAQAAATFERLLSREPEPRLAVEAAWARGRILDELGQSDAALAMYDRILDRHAKSAVHPEALLAAARLRHKLRQDTDADALYAQFVSQYPADSRLDAVLYEWSWVLRDAGKAAESSAMLRRLCEQYPQSAYRPDAMYRLALRARDAQQDDEAEEWLARLLAGKPPEAIAAHALCLRWQIAAGRKQWNHVRAAAERLAEDYPKSPLRPMAEFWVAECDYREGNYRAAGRRLDELAARMGQRRDPWLAVVALRRAQVLAHGGKWTDAQRLASTIPEQYPDFPQRYEVDYLLGRCLASQAEFEAAREAYGRVIRSETGAKTETAAMAQWMIGETYFHQKDYEAAVREYLRVEILYAYPRWQAAALLQAGKCRERLGEREAAAALYSRVVSAYPQTPFADQARQRLAALSRPSEPNRSSAVRPTAVPSR